MRFRQLEENIKAAVTEALPRLQNAEDARVRAEQEKTRASLIAAGQEEGSVQTPIKKTAGYGRNDIVTIKKGGETRKIKFKKAEPLLNDGWEIVNQD